MSNTTHEQSLLVARVKKCSKGKKRRVVHCFDCGLVFFSLRGSGTCSVRTLNRAVWYINITVAYLEQANEFGQIQLVYRAPGFASELTETVIVVSAGVGKGSRAGFSA